MDCVSDASPSCPQLTYVWLPRPLETPNEGCGDSQVYLLEVSHSMPKLGERPAQNRRASVRSAGISFAEMFVVKHRSRLRFVLEGLEGVAVLGATFLTWPVCKPWLRNWGALASELQDPWPGDTLVTANLAPNTRAIGISAPAEEVWPWLVQFGFGKAGFYSYELLERLVGIPVANLEEIEPCMQSIEIGDEILLHPKAPGIPIAMVEPNRYICFGKKRDSNSTTSQESLERSWSFYLVPVTANTSRLLVRGCFEETRRRSLGQRLGFAMEQPIDFVMEQRMLRTIRRLAEAS